MLFAFSLSVETLLNLLSLSACSIIWRSYLRTRKCRRRDTRERLRVLASSGVALFSEINDILGSRCFPRVCNLCASGTERRERERRKRERGGERKKERVFLRIQEVWISIVWRRVNKHDADLPLVELARESRRYLPFIPRLEIRFVVGQLHAREGEANNDGVRVPRSRKRDGRIEQL